MPASKPAQDIIDNPEQPHTLEYLAQNVRAARHQNKITNKNLLFTNPAYRDKSGKLASHAWPGCYPLVFGNALGQALCPKCANNTLDDFPESDAVSCTIHYEGAPIECDRCGQLVDSAYGDPLDDELEAEHCANCNAQLTNQNIQLALDAANFPQVCLEFYCPSYTVEDSDSGSYHTCLSTRGDDKRPAVFRIKSIRLDD